MKKSIYNIFQFCVIKKFLFALVFAMCFSQVCFSILPEKQDLESLLSSDKSESIEHLDKMLSEEDSGAIVRWLHRPMCESGQAAVAASPLAMAAKAESSKMLDFFVGKIKQHFKEQEENGESLWGKDSSWPIGLEFLVQSGNCPYSGSNPVQYCKECQPEISSLHRAATSNAPLRWSSQSEFYESNKEFAEAPVDYHMRPLHWAAHTGKIKLAITLMCLFGVDVNARACGDLTPLHFAANSGNPAITNSLLEFGADPNALSSNSESPLHLVTTWQSASLFVAAGANVSEKNSVGNSPLHETAIYDRLPVMRVLLENGAKINALNKKGDTALFETLAFKHPKGSHPLIDAGADPWCTGRDYLPAQVAKNRNISPDLLPKVLRPEPSSLLVCIPSGPLCKAGPHGKECQANNPSS